ncbi:hypothetical protein BU17DRAFT_84070 [Hysterangium stoloniferum]|nr:hypothetical protein BU17DRAFT_84070 [Hysterangium stoloniferum]
MSKRLRQRDLKRIKLDPAIILLDAQTESRRFILAGPFDEVEEYKSYKEYGITTPTVLRRIHEEIFDAWSRQEWVSQPTTEEVTDYVLKFWDGFSSIRVSRSQRSIYSGLRDLDKKAGRVLHNQAQCEPRDVQKRYYYHPGTSQRPAYAHDVPLPPIPDEMLEGDLFQWRRRALIQEFEDKGYFDHHDKFCTHCTIRLQRDAGASLIEDSDELSYPADAWDSWMYKNGRRTNYCPVHGGQSCYHLHLDVVSEHSASLAYAAGLPKKEFPSLPAPPMPVYPLIPLVDAHPSSPHSPAGLATLANRFFPDYLNSRMVAPPSGVGNMKCVPSKLDVVVKSEDYSGHMPMIYPGTSNFESVSERSRLGNASRYKGDDRLVGGHFPGERDDRSTTRKRGREAEEDAGAEPDTTGLKNGPSKKKRIQGNGKGVGNRSSYGSKPGVPLRRSPRFKKSAPAAAARKPRACSGVPVRRSPRFKKSAPAAVPKRIIDEDYD